MFNLPTYKEEHFFLQWLVLQKHSLKILNSFPWNTLLYIPHEKIGLINTQGKKNVALAI